MEAETASKTLGERYSKGSRPGFKAEGDAARFLRYGALWTVEESPVRKIAGVAAAIVEHCMTHWRAALPIHRWLVDTLQR